MHLTKIDWTGVAAKECSLAPIEGHIFVLKSQKPQRLVNQWSTEHIQWSHHLLASQKQQQSAKSVPKIVTNKKLSICVKWIWWESMYSHYTLQDSRMTVVTMQQPPVCCLTHADLINPLFLIESFGWIHLSNLFVLPVYLRFSLDVLQSICAAVSSCCSNKPNFLTGIHKASSYLFMTTGRSVSVHTFMWLLSHFLSLFSCYSSSVALITWVNL